MAAALFADVARAAGTLMEAPKSSRLRVREEVKEGVRGAAKVATLALNVAARATEDVPRLRPISTALAESSQKIQTMCGDDPNSYHSAIQMEPVLPYLEETPEQSRFDNSIDLKEGMEGAIRVAIIVLSVAMQMTQNVPYLGAISTALKEFVKIQSEVGHCEAACRATMAEAEEMRKIIERFRARCTESGKGDSVLSSSLRDAFTELEEIVLECILTLQKCKVDSKRKRDRIRLYLMRSELTKSIKACSSRMSKAVQYFNTTLQVDQSILLEDIHSTIKEMHQAQTPGVLRTVIPALSPTWRRRIAAVRVVHTLAKAVATDDHNE
ncbi:unnamed protein product [Peniophora sp. CBMAI 1063]|nr:unnamed protein product [Peniophora sp. CBMAI 1063]